MEKKVFKTGSGVKINFLGKVEKQNIRVLIRYSGTENLLRILLEGKDEEKLNTAMKEVSSFLKSKLNA